eukprot:COSAG02_NODE_151_length_33583_cov_25.995042_7_plen_43_part_00
MKAGELALVAQDPCSWGGMWGRGRCAGVAAAAGVGGPAALVV